jgi:dipeptidyl aminopeptidase/acylaminoacyl peptidase
MRRFAGFMGKIILDPTHDGCSNLSGGNMRARRLAYFVLSLTCLAVASIAGANSQAAPPAYQRPPKAITDILAVPPPPLVLISPTHDNLLLVQPEAYPPIAELAEPMLRLAGLRINPQTNGPHVPPRYVSLALQSLATGKQQPLSLPPNCRFGLPAWSPDGARFAVSVTFADKIALWVGDVETSAVRQVPGLTLNAAHGAPFHWMPGSKELLCQTVPAGRGKPPAPPRVPTGPVIQESAGKLSPVRTIQDLLQNPHDEDLFDYYTTGQLAFVSVPDNKVTLLGKPGIFKTVQPAPDGRHVLVVRHHRPYSYLVPASAFPSQVEVWDRTGGIAAAIADLPLADAVPIQGVPTGPREFHWVPTEPATLVWVEALDGGDPKKQAPLRDELKQLRIGEPAPITLTKTQHRFAGLTFGPKGTPALLSDYNRNTRRRRTFLFDISQPGPLASLLWDRSIQDRYNDPGTPMLRTLPSARSWTGTI